MPLFEVTPAGLRTVLPCSFASEGIRERQDLQQWLRFNPSVFGENLFVIAEEFGNWEDSRRRIDLLALDEDGNLVVIELKRSDDGGHMELQSLRYAAMVSAMRFVDVVEAHRIHQSKYDPDHVEEAESRIRSFLGTPADEEATISTVPRIILVAADFSREVTTTVLWLIDRGVDIRCMQIAPYKVGDSVLVDLRQVIPLAQAGDYQVRLRQKEEAARQTGGRRELTLKVLLRHGILAPGTEIEVIPAALPDGMPSPISDTFRARVGDPEKRASMIWLMDEQAYSLSALTLKLHSEFGMKWLVNNIYPHWRLRGANESLWDTAERLAPRDS